MLLGVVALGRGVAQACACLRIDETGGGADEKTIVYGVTEFDLSDTTLLTVGAEYLYNDPRGFSTTGLPMLDNKGKQLNLSRSDNPASRDSTNRQESVNAFASLEQKLGTE